MSLTDRLKEQALLCDEVKAKVGLLLQDALPLTQRESLLFEALNWVLQEQVRTQLLLLALSEEFRAKLEPNPQRPQGDC